MSAIESIIEKAEFFEVEDLFAERPLCVGEVFVAGGRATVATDAIMHVEREYNGSSGPSPVDVIDRATV